MADSTNQKTQPVQTNNFTGGMNTDISDALLGELYYRDAVNLRLVTSKNGNGYTLHTMDGTSTAVVFTSNSAVVTVSGNIIDQVTIRNYNILITVSNSNWLVYKYDTLLNTGTNLAPSYELTKVFGCSTGTALYKYSDNNYHLSIVTKWEDDDNVKVYIADGGNPIRIVNIAKTYTVTTDEALMLYPAVSFNKLRLNAFTNGSLKAGMIQYCYYLYNKYGSQSEISPLTELYPLALNTSSAKASAVTGQYEDTNTGVGMQLAVDITDTLANEFDHIAVISISYTENGLLPTISLLSLRSIDSGTYYYTNYDNTAIDTYTVDEFNALTGIKFVPLLIETKNNYLFASNIKYQDNIYDITYDARAYRYMWANETSYDTYDPVYPNATISATDMITDIYLSSTNAYTTFNLGLLTLGLIPSTHDCINLYNDLSVNASMFKYVRTTNYNLNKYAFYLDQLTSMILYGGKGINVSWRFTIAELAEDTTPASYGFNYNGTTSNKLYGSIGTNNGTIKAYDSSAGQFQGVWLSNVAYDGSLVNRHFYKMQDNITTSNRNYSNPLIASNLKSLLRDEVYRYGIVFYNKYGTKSQVNWIGDIRTPSATEHGFETFIANKKVSFLADGSDAFECGLVTRPLGIEFEISSLPADAVSYEIVRCKRTQSDRATLTQGVITTIVSRTTTDSLDSSKTITPLMTPSEMPTSNPDYKSDYNGYWNGLGTGSCHYYTYGNRLYYNFFSPEISYLYDTEKTQLNSSELSLSPINYLFSASCQGDSATPVHTSNAEIYCYDRSYPYGLNLLNASCYHTNVGSLLEFEPALQAADSMYENCYLNQYTGANSYTSHAIVAKFYELSDRMYNDTHVNYKYHKLSDLQFPLEPTWSDYKNKDSFLSSINGNLYNNWAFGFYSTGTTSETGKYMLLGPHGRSIVIALDGSVTSILNNGESEITSYRKTVNSDSLDTSIVYTTIQSETNNGLTSYPESKAGVFLCNLRKSVIPYGGYDYDSRKYCTYYSTGSYFGQDSIGSTTTTYSFIGPGHKTYYYTQVTPIVNQLFDGDTYICNFDCTKLHRYHYSDTSTSWSTEATSLDNALLRACVTFVVPVETAINLSLDLGLTYHRSNSPELQLQASDVDSKYTQSKPLYVYNTAYSVMSQVIPCTPLNDDDKYDRTIDTRTLYSNKKSTDENVDSWSIFQSANYLDVESRYGAITDLRLFNNDLIFWQRDSTGHFSVLEKSLLSTSDLEPLVLGTGEVLSRYDYLSTVNGMKDLQRCDTQSEKVLYWFDYDRNELCTFTNGVAQLSKAKGVLNYLNTLKSNNLILSKPSLQYSRYYDEMLATLQSGYSLVYNELMDLFSGRTTLTCNESTVNNSGDTFYVDNNNIYKTVHTNNTPISILGSYTYPSIQYIVNAFYNNVKTFDNVEFALATDGGDDSNYTDLQFVFSTDSYTDMSTTLDGENLTEREYSYRGAIPRYGDSTLGNRMRGRVLYSKLSYNTANHGLELPYILTKFRVSNS